MSDNTMMQARLRGYAQGVWDVWRWIDHEVEYGDLDPIAIRDGVRAMAKAADDVAAGV